MTDNNFSNQEWLTTTIENYLKKENFKYSKENPDPEVINFQFEIDHETTKLKILIGQVKEQIHKIDVVSVVSFSPMHIEALEKAPEEEKEALKNDLLFWLTPREPDHAVFLESKEPDQVPHYLVLLSIYEGDLTLGNLMKNIRLVFKSSVIARRLIQLRLNKYVKKDNTEVRSEENE